MIELLVHGHGSGASDFRMDLHVASGFRISVRQLQSQMGVSFLTKNLIARLSEKTPILSEAKPNQQRPSQCRRQSC